MNKTFKVFSYIWRFTKKYKISFFGTFFLFGSMVFLEDAIIPVFIKKLIDSLTSNMLDEAFTFGIYILVAMMVSKIFIWSAMRLLTYFQVRSVRDLHNFSFREFTKHSSHFYANNFTGSLIEKLPRLGDNSIGLVDNILFNLFSISVTVIGIFIILFRENSRIALTFFIFLFTYVVFILYMGKKLAPLYGERSKAKSQLRAFISDVISNIQTVKVFSSLNYEFDKFKKVNNNLKEKREKAWVTAVNYQDTIGIVPPLFTGLVTLYSIHLVQIGVMTTGTVIMIFILGNRFGHQIWRLGGSMKRFSSDISDCAESIEIIEKKPEIKDLDGFNECTIDDGEINFKNVNFVYPQGEHVFKNLNLKIPAGQSVGIVGKSGSGKTTLTKLLLRFYDLNDGSIIIDNQNISQLRRDDLRLNIAYIPQETILFHRSIYENISYGQLNASEDEIMEAAKAAHVDEFVKKLEHGYDTEVGERGIKLSGGQRQRIGIARAMLRKNAPILILDEATSSLDSVSEYFIQQSFSKLSQNRTTIVIAHRLSTIQQLDRIIVMDNGNVIEDGSHDELLAKKGYYHKLWNSQVNGFILEE